MFSKKYLHDGHAFKLGTTEQRWGNSIPVVSLKIYRLVELQKLNSPLSPQYRQCHVIRMPDSIPMLTELTVARVKTYSIDHRTPEAQRLNQKNNRSTSSRESISVYKEKLNATDWNLITLAGITPKCNTAFFGRRLLSFLV